MDNVHRQRIITNLKTLVEGTIDFDIVFNSLIKRKVFNEYMAREILSKDPQNRLEFMYRYVTTRGPKAFRELLNTLNATNHLELAALLVEHSSYRVMINGNSSNKLTLEEEYPVDEEWTVTTANHRFDLDKEKVYKMSSRTKGLALIINIHSFINNTWPVREGSEHDVRRLTSVLGQLDYKVLVHIDLKRHAIEETMKEFANMKDHWDCDSSIVFVMSHGQEGPHTSSNHTVNFVCHDCQVINSEKIIEELMAYKCKALRGKPKLFFFQACRGGNFNYPVSASEGTQRDTSNISNFQTDGMIMTPSDSIRNDADILIGHSTSPGNVSMRDPWGSWYIQTLCRVFAKYAWCEDLITMLQYVDCIVKNMTYMGTHQTSTLTDLQVKKFYFQPGIYDIEVPLV